MAKLSELIIRIGADARGLERDLGKVEGKMKRMSRQIGDLGRRWTSAVTVPIVAGFTLAGREAMQFEAELAKVEGLVGLTSSEVAGMRNEILKLGPAVGKGPKELAEGLFFVTSAGMRGKEAMDVLTMAAKASAAGLGETKTIADLVTSAINAYGSENLNAAGATDILVAAVREGKAEASELAGSMGQVLPLAAEMGVSFDQVGAATAAMTRTGTDAATAATQLRQIMASLLKPTKQSEEALMAMGSSSAELRDTIQEDGLLAALMEIRELTNQYGEEVMAEVFPNIRALSGVLDLMGENAEENAQIFEELTDATGALDHAFSVTEETAQFKLNRALSQMRTSLSTLGETVLQQVVPILGKLNEILERVTDWWVSLDDSTKEWIVRAAIAVAAIGPLLLALSGLLSAGSAVIGALKVIAGALAFLVSPIGIVVAAIVGLGAAWLKWSDEIKVIAKGLAVYVEAAFDLLASRVSYAWHAIGKVIWDTLDSIMDAVRPFVRWMPAAFRDSFDAMATFVEEKSGRAAHAVDRASGDIGDALKRIDAAKYHMSKAWTDSSDQMVAGTNAVIDAEQELFQEMGPVNEVITEGSGEARDLGDAYEGVGNAAAGAAAQVGDLADAVEEATGQMSTAAGRSEVLSFAEAAAARGLDVKAYRDEVIAMSEQRLRDHAARVSGYDESRVAVDLQRVRESIPQLASGGIVNRPTIAMVGEAGPEAVVPLDGGFEERIARAVLRYVKPSMYNENHFHSPRPISEYEARRQMERLNRQQAVEWGVVR